MKIQLVNPHNKENMYAAPKFFRYADKVSKGLNFNAMGALFPSLNLSSLAAVTQTEHEVAIDDGCLGPVTAQCSADLVGITAMTSQAPAAHALADQYRARGIPVVIGGIHASMCPDEAAEHADTVVIGEAERLWPELIQDFAAGTLRSSYRDSAAVDLAEIPIPRRDLLDPRGYVAFNSVETTRGCPFNCNFCSVTRMSGIKYRFRPIAKVIEEVRGLSGRTVYFVDEQFDQEARIIHRDWSKYDLGEVVFAHPLLAAKRLHFEKNHAYRRFYSIRSMIKRLGLPRNRGDLLVWIINLAFRGFLTNRWGNEYWRWKEKEKESEMVDASPALSMPDLRKIEENKGLVEQQP